MKRLGFMAVLLVGTTACRPGEGERCFCQGECRGGLVCAVNGAVLPQDRCIDSVMASSVEAGICIDGDGAPSSENDLNPPPFLDLGPWATDSTPLPPEPSTSEATDTDVMTATDTDVMTSTDPSSGSSGSTAATDASGSSSSSSGGSGGSSTSSTGSSSGSGSESTAAG